MTGTSFQFVPYRGTAPALRDLLAGQIDIMLDQASNVLPQLNAGAIKGFAVTAKERLASAPQVPTVAEAGLPGLLVSVWHGLWAPKGTPADIIAKLNAAVVKSLAEPATKEKLGALGRGHPARRPAHAARRWAPGRRPRSRSGGPSSSRGDQRRMKLGVLQFFSWPGRHGLLKKSTHAPSSASRSWTAPASMRCGWPSITSTYSVCPSVHMVGTLAAAPHQAPAHRHGGVAGGALSSAAAGRGGGAARPAVGRARQLGRWAWLCPFGIQCFGVPPEESADRFREAVEIVLKAWTEERLTYKGQHFSFDGRRAAAQAAAADHIRRSGWRRPRSPPSTGRRAAAFPS